MTRARSLEVAQAALAALPLLVFAWPGPGALLVGQLYPELSGTGIVAMAAAASMLLAVLRGAPMRFAGSTALFGYLVMLFAVQRRFWVWNPNIDWLEWDRALLLLLSGAGLALTGASLGATGRATLVRLLACSSLVFTLGALCGVQGRSFGTLGNTGATAAAALPGALCGAWLAVTGDTHRVWRLFGLLTLLAFSGYAASAPALTGLVALGSTLLLAALAMKRARPAVLGMLGGAAVAALLGQFLAALPAAHGPVAGPSASTGHLGGLDVRLAIARSSLHLLADHASFGIGPGQFRACFPPYRDKDELARSNAGAAAGIETEVEHAHDDWLQGVVEGGLVGGALWLWFLVACVRASWAAMKSGEGDRAALGMGVIALAVCAALRSALLFDPASSSAFFVCAGVVLARPVAGETSRIRMLVPAVVALLLLAQIANAREFVRHGAALRLVATGSDDPTRDKRPPGPAELEQALAARPDSAMALGLLARARDATGSHSGTELWERLIALRPFNLEALAQLAHAYADAGREAEARKLWQRALQVNPRHGAILRNLALSSARAGDSAATQSALTQLRATGQLTPDWLVGSAATEILRGHDSAGAILLDQQAPELRKLFDAPPEVQYAEAESRSSATAPEERLLADALACRAHTAWARDHALAARFDAAVRSYRQALLASSRGLGQTTTQGAPHLHLELAAALLAAGKPDEARRELATSPEPRDGTSLPDWASQQLRAAGLLASP